MGTKRIMEMENPSMKKGEVIIVTCDEGEHKDRNYIKIASEDGNFNDFDYGLPANDSNNKQETIIFKFATSSTATCTHTKEQCIENHFTGNFQFYYPSSGINIHSCVHRGKSSNGNTLTYYFIDGGGFLITIKWTSDGVINYNKSPIIPEQSS